MVLPVFLSYRSLPMRERGLKFFIDSFPTNYPPSLPMRERGLK